MSELEQEIVDGIAVLTMNVPGKKNALTDVLRSELREAVFDAQERDDIRALVLTGAGDAFCSGGDISAMTADPEIATGRMTILHDVVRMLVAGAKPSVAAVAGSAFGAGFSLAMCCDQVVANENARFCASFARMCLPPDLGLAWTLPRRIGSASAGYLLLSGKVVGIDEAETLGLIDHRAGQDDLLVSAIGRARELSAHTLESKAHVKRLLNISGGDIDLALRTEMESYLALLKSREHIEAREAFFAASRKKG